MSRERHPVFAFLPAGPSLPESRFDLEAHVIDRGATRVARRARGRLPAAHEFGGPDGRGAVDEVHPADGSGSRVPGVEKRAGDSAPLPSAGAAREGPHPGRLGYALWVTLKHLLHRGGTGLTPASALAQLATLQSADIILPTTDGREIRSVVWRRPPQSSSSRSSTRSTSPFRPISNGTPNVVQTS